MKTLDIAALLNRAAAALENRKDLTAQETLELIEDLTAAADEMTHEPDDVMGDHMGRND